MNTLSLPSTHTLSFPSHLPSFGPLSFPSHPPSPLVHPSLSLTPFSLCTISSHHTFSSCLAIQTFGNGSVAQAVLSQDRDEQPLGTEMSINLGYGVGVMIGAYIAIGVTGAHMNPAVTLAMALRGRTSWLKVRSKTN